MRNPGTQARSGTVLVIGCALAAFASSCRSTPDSNLDRIKRAFELAEEGVRLVEAGLRDVALAQNPHEGFVKNEKLNKGLALYEEAHALQPLSSKINYDYAILSAKFGEAWDAIRLQKGDASLRAGQGGRTAEAEGLAVESDAAWEKARRHYLAALPLFRAVPQESASIPREMYARSLFEAATIHVKLDRGIEDLEAAQALLQESVDIGQVKGEWRQKMETLIHMINQEIVDRRLAKGGS